MRTSLICTLLVALVLASHASGAVTAPRTDSDHKFAKREPAPRTVVHNHYHGSSGGGGGFGGSSGSGMSAGKTLLVGTALAGAGGFAATGGSMAAHHLFDGHDDDDDKHERGGGEGGRGGEYPQQVAAAPQQQLVGTAHLQTGRAAASGPVVPVAILMSDGSYAPFIAQQDGAVRQSAPVSAGAGAGQAAGGGPIVFPSANAQ